MTSYVSGRDIKNDVLFRASESIGGTSGWNTKVFDYINRGYRTIAEGGSEFLPEDVEDWWWMRLRGVLTLLPVQTGVVAVTKDSINITFSVAPTTSLAGRRFKVSDFGESYIISTHTAAAQAATLDSAYNGETNAAAAYNAMKLEYTLGSDVSSLLSPMIGYRDGVDQIIGMPPERMDTLYPYGRIETGWPDAFTLESESVVRFNRGGNLSGTSQRVEYRYKPIVTDLTDSETSIPLLPLRYRSILADIALVYLMVDKNDDRAQTIISGVKQLSRAMWRENRRRLTKIDNNLGRIFPRQSRMPVNNRLLRTDSGLIIGF